MPAIQYFSLILSQKFYSFTSIDYEGEINRIIAILKHTANNLYPAVSVGDGLLRDVLFDEDSHKIHDGSFTYCLVTTPDNTMT